MSVDLEKLIRKYLKDGRIMQVATVHNNQPWSCTVYYASDERERANIIHIEDGVVLHHPTYFSFNT